MKIVVADATPVHYLILIDATHILPSLFHTIHVPGQVRDELTHAATPDPVKIWMRHAPEWLGIVPTTLNPETSSVLAALDVGEQGAITLAESLRADLLLIDDRAGAEIAERRGLSVTGTLGVLDLAARISQKATLKID